MNFIEKLSGKLKELGGSSIAKAVGKLALDATPVGPIIDLVQAFLPDEPAGPITEEVSERLLVAIEADADAAGKVLIAETHHEDLVLEYAYKTEALEVDDRKDARDNQEKGLVGLPIWVRIVSALQRPIWSTGSFMLFAVTIVSTTRELSTNQMIVILTVVGFYFGSKIIKEDAPNKVAGLINKAKGLFNR